MCSLSFSDLNNFRLVYKSSHLFLSVRSSSYFFVSSSSSLRNSDANLFYSFEADFVGEVKS